MITLDMNEITNDAIGFLLWKVHNSSDHKWLQKINNNYFLTNCIDFEILKI